MVARRAIFLFLVFGLILIGCNNEPAALPTSPPSVITATARAAKTATIKALPTSTNTPVPATKLPSPTIVVVTKSADISPTPLPIETAPNPVGTKTPEDFLQQAELNLVASQSVQIERTFDLRLPGLTQTISSSCELVLPTDIYCLSMTESQFTESADNPQSYQIELWQSAKNAYIRQENGTWQDISASEPSFMIDEVSSLLHMGELTAVNSITETTLNDIPVYEINYSMDALAYLEKSSGSQIKELLSNAEDTALKATAWISQENNILLQQNIILEFFKDNSWVHVENDVVFSNHNQLTQLSISAP